MTQSIRIAGEEATLLIDDEEIPSDAVISWSAGRVAAMIRAGYMTGHESGKTEVFDVIKAHPELFANGGAPSFEAAAAGDADVTLRETRFVLDGAGKITGTVERVVTPRVVTPQPRRRSTDRGNPR